MKKLTYITLIGFFICTTSCKTMSLFTSKNKKTGDFHLSHAKNVIKKSEKQNSQRKSDQMKKSTEGKAQELNNKKAAEANKKGKKVNTGRFIFY